MPRLLLLVSVWAFACGTPSRASIEAAFKKDGFAVSRWESTSDGEGCLALSTTATNFRTKQPKKAFYLRGKPNACGAIVARLARDDLEVVCTEFLRKIPLALLDPAWVASHDPPIVRELERLITALLTVDTVKAFDAEQARGVLPPFLLEEMQGLADEQHRLNASTAVTVDVLKTLNYGFDVITARVFSGHFLIETLAGAASASLKRALNRSPHFFRQPAYCNGIGVRKGWVKPGYSGFLGRDFQFATAGVIQDFLASAIFVPAPGASGFPAAGIMAPGFVGFFAAINSEGVAMGVNTIRSSNANATNVGLNSLLMIRAATLTARSLDEAVAFVSTSARGAPFMYPVCDGSGSCAVLEAGRWLPDGVQESPLNFVRPELKRRGLVPSESFLEQNAFPPEWRSNGVYVRHMEYVYPAQYVSKFNPDLFAFKKTVYNATGFEFGQFVYANFTLDNDSRMENLFFMPQKETDPDLVIVSNFGVVPENRLMMMSVIDDWLSRATADALVWRYDMMLKLLFENMGSIDFDRMIWIMSFLSPDRTPGYWTERIVANDPLSAIVEGSTSVFDLKNRAMSSLTGYFHDNWVNITLPNYLD